MTKYPVIVEGAADVAGILLGVVAGAVVLPVFFAANVVVRVSEWVRGGVGFLLTGDLG